MTANILTPDCALDCTIRQSPNFGPRKSGLTADILLLHYTAMASGEAAINWLCEPSSGVSCHYLVDVDGAVTQMVAEDQRAWHAGLASWEGEADVNSRSIGIEIQNAGHDGGLPGYPDAQMAAVTALCADILRRHIIAPHRVLGHSDVAPFRKIDPGEHFDWAMLARAGIGHWVAPVAPVAPVEAADGPVLGEGDSGAQVEALQKMLENYGYGIEVTGTYGKATRLVIEAFQRHFRPARVDGLCDLSTKLTLERLLGARQALV